MRVKLLLTLLIGFSLQAQTPVTISVGAGYANQVWYSLQTDAKAVQSKDNWDLGFEITGYAASIVANTQKANLVVYKAPFSALQFGTLDTVGIASWPKLYNADTSWSVGAFNTTANPANPNDLGWGLYDPNTHYITGDSCYVVKLAADVYKKLLIDNLSTGVYYFTYADIDGNNEKQASVSKTDYKGKNFGYFNLTEGKAVDREPLAKDWDLSFTRYTAFVTSGKTIVPYGVLGVLHNKGLTVAQANNVPDVANYVDYTAHKFVTAINEIGYDWKFNNANFEWEIPQDTCYFVKDKTNRIWKLRFTGFGGSANGNIEFSKEELITTGILDESGSQIATFSIYPNPAIGDQLQILLGSELSLSGLEATVVDQYGSVLVSQDLSVRTGISQASVNVSHLRSGIYSFVLKTDTQTHVQKFVKP